MAGKNIDILVSFPCLSAMVESAIELGGLAKYLIAPQGVEQAAQKVADAAQDAADVAKS